MKNNFLLEVILGQELLNYLNHFLVPPGKTGASQTNPDLGFVVFHEYIQIIVSKITIKMATIRKKSKIVVKFASRKLCYSNNNVFQITEWVSNLLIF